MYTATPIKTRRETACFCDPSVTNGTASSDGSLVRDGWIHHDSDQFPSILFMKRQSIALFLSTLALAGGTVACSQAPEGGEKGGEKDLQPQAQPTSPSTPAPGKVEGGEGEEGGEGGEG